jgi:hypothetical protein
MVAPTMSFDRASLGIATQLAAADPANTGWPCDVEHVRQQIVESKLAV